MMKIVHSGDRVISRGSEGELERRSCSFVALRQRTLIIQRMQKTFLAEIFLVVSILNIL